MRLGDAQRRGGPEYAYRLRISPPRPDFALRVVPSCINASSWRLTPVTVFALRKDGFDGDIALSLKDNPEGAGAGRRSWCRPARTASASRCRSPRVKLPAETAEGKDRVEFTIFGVLLFLPLLLQRNCLTTFDGPEKDLGDLIAEFLPPCRSSAVPAFMASNSSRQNRRPATSGAGFTAIHRWPRAASTAAADSGR